MGALADSKAERVAAKQVAVTELVRRLTPVADMLGGRFVLFGSAARNELRYDSDIDLLLDFPDAASTQEAWRLAEDVCADLQLPRDIMPLSWCSKEFLDHVLKEARAIP